MLRYIIIRRHINMLEEITTLYDLVVYTEHGVYIGEVSDVTINPDTCEIEGLILGETNDTIVEEGRGVAVPFRWIQAVGDIIILKHFPPRVDMTPEERGEWERQNG
jgi:sporulation protein YlmC with PRC-barrel domain